MNNVRRTDAHFKRWYSVYKRYIDELWRMFNGSMANYIQEPVRYTYTEFVDFVYWKSSGYISEYA
jgi:hypothetical protein